GTRLSPRSSPPPMRRATASRAPDPVRELILELWQDLQSGLDVAAELVARGFRRERHLAVAERQAIKERFYRMVAMARRIDCLLATTRARLDMPRAWDEARYVATMLLGGETDAAGAAALAPHLRVDWHAVVAADQALAADPDPRRRLA